MEDNTFSYEQLLLRAKVAGKYITESISSAERPFFLQVFPLSTIVAYLAFLDQKTLPSGIIESGEGQHPLARLYVHHY